MPLGFRTTGAGIKYLPTTLHPKIPQFDFKNLSSCSLYICRNLTLGSQPKHANWMSSLKTKTGKVPKKNKASRKTNKTTGAEGRKEGRKGRKGEGREGREGRGGREGRKEGRKEGRNKQTEHSCTLPLFWACNGRYYSISMRSYCIPALVECWNILLFWHFLTCVSPMLRWI